MREERERERKAEKERIAVVRKKKQKENTKREVQGFAQASFLAVAAVVQEEEQRGQIAAVMKEKQRRKERKMEGMRFERAMLSVDSEAEKEVLLAVDRKQEG